MRPVSRIRHNLNSFFALVIASVLVLGCQNVEKMTLRSLSGSSSSSSSGKWGSSSVSGPLLWIGAFPEQMAFGPKLAPTPVKGDGGLNISGSLSGGNSFLSGYLYVADTGNHRIVRYDANTGAFTGWIGKIALPPTGGDAGCSTAAAHTFTPGWCLGGTSESANSYGAMNLPQGIVADPTGFLYVTDVSNHRVSRYDLTTGQPQGWIGRIATPAGACVGTSTASWCTSAGALPGGGGTFGDNEFSAPQGITVSGTSIYVADRSNHRITKHLASTGSFTGWLGKVGGIAAVGGGNCGSVNTFSGAWCTGGSSAAGNAGDGSMNSPKSLSISAGVMYVADNINNRVNRYNEGTGAFTGWIGTIGAGGPPTAPGSCNAAGVGVATPDWCIGGFSQNGSGDGMLTGPSAAFVQANTLYVSDSSNFRVQKFDISTGSTFMGWIGKIQVSPASPASCSGAALQTFTPDWCFGGGASSVSSPNAINGAFGSPLGISSNGSSMLYVTDGTNNRINRYDLSAGVASGGWLGTNITALSGWSPYDDVVTIGSIGDGVFNLPRGIARDGTYLYIADSSNNRIVRVDEASGAFAGWVGNVLSSPTSGAAGCAGATAGTAAPGWCYGGKSQLGTGNGMFSNPRAVATDGAYLYVVEYNNHRIQRLNMDGSSAGWIGRVNLAGGGGGNCAVVGSFSGAWCTSGTSGAGTSTGDGRMTNPIGITVDSGVLYVVDSNFCRVYSFATTGVFIGWLGATGGTAAAGGGNCTSINSPTNAWCTGGVSACGGLGANDGSISGGPPPLGGIDVDSSFLYVTDNGHAKINRYNRVTGSFQGSILNATAGGGTCLGLGLTNGWCTQNGGGLTFAGGTTTDGAMNAPAGLAVDTSLNRLFTTDSTNHRVNLYDLTTGLFVGYMGLVGATAPTGGDAGCTTAVEGQRTPGACFGGTALNTSNTTLGGLSSPGAVTVYPGGIYVSDTNNHRVKRYEK